MRNITIVFIFTCLLFLTGCTTEVESDERDPYIIEEVTETVEETEPFKIRQISQNWGHSFSIDHYDIYFVPEDERRYEILSGYTSICILPEDYEILKNKKATTLTLDEIKTLKNNYDSYVKKLKEEKNKEANRERTPEEVYSSY